MTINQIKDKLDKLKCVTFEPRILKLRREILKEREPEIKELEKQLEELRNNRPKKKERWPENTPEHIQKICSNYWKGTVEYSQYRIHEWNDKAVWTSYPAGGYSSNGGWNPTPAAYYLLSLTEGKYSKPLVIKCLSFERCSGKRVTATMRKEALDEL